MGYRLHWSLPVFMCVVLNMLDGYDVLIISLVSPTIAKEWSLSGAQLGALFSSGVAGMVLGSIGLAPSADRLGRRTLVLRAIIIVAIGMGVSAVSRNYYELSACRFLAGLGIGGILACATVLVAEYAPAERKAMASFLYVAGYSLGATVGGALAASFIQHGAWRLAFVGGAIGSVVLLPLALLFLPESKSFRMAIESHALARGQADPKRRFGPLALLSKNRKTTLLLWLAFFFSYASYYFFISWTPKLLVADGHSTHDAMQAGILLNLGGFAGSILFALVSNSLKLRSLLIFCLLISALAMPVFPWAASLATYMPVLGAMFLGITTTGAQASYYALTPRLYEPLARSAGMGWAVGVGRVGAIVAPLITGLLLDLAWTTGALFALFGGALAVSAATAMLIPNQDREFESNDRSARDTAASGPPLQSGA